MKYLKLFEMYDGENHEKDYMMNRSSIERKKEIEEVSDYLKDIFIELSEYFHIKCQDSSKYLRSSDIKITINLLKKSSEFKKSDGSDDWSKFKQSTFKADEVIEQILTSKSYIESIDGVLSKVWVHIENPNSGVKLSFDEFLKSYSDLGNLVQINIEYII